MLVTPCKINVQKIVRMDGGYFVLGQLIIQINEEIKPGALCTIFPIISRTGNVLSHRKY